MNAFSKVLVVFILLLSAGFAVSQMVLHARRVDWQVKAKTASEELVKVRGDLATANGALEAKTTEYDKVVAAKLMVDAALVEAKEVRDREIASLQNDKKLLQAIDTDQRLTVKARDEQIAQKNTQIENLKTSEETLTAALRGEEQQVAALKQEQRQKANEIDGLKDRVASLTSKNAEMASEMKTAVNRLAALQAQGVDIGVGKQRLIECHVVGVDPEFGGVVLDCGEDDKVKVGNTFTIYRGVEPLAKVTVTKIRKQNSIAQLAPGGLYDESMPLAVGDKATTAFH